MKRVLYYSDPLNDDFASNEISTKKLGKDFVYVRTNPFWRACAFLVYHGFARPVTFLWLKLKFAHRINGRELLRPFRKTGYFIFANHTNGDLDAFVPSRLAAPKKAYIVCSPDATSIKGIKGLVQMLGGIPVFTGVSGAGKFKEAITRRIREKKAVAIYPEAHIWPYYTGIRPFKDVSMAYPCETGAPCFAVTNVYLRRKIPFFGRPRVLSVVKGPFYPGNDLPPKEARKKLRDEILAAMEETAAEYEQYEYVEYVFKPKNSEN